MMGLSKRILVVLCAVVALVAVVRNSDAQPHGRYRSRDRYTISLITMSPGDPIFFRFGHNGILVHDALLQTHLVYNWGTFSFEEPGLVKKFLQGRLTYWLSVDELAPTAKHYKGENRWILEQELNLTTEQKQRIVQYIETNALPENCAYRYHYYNDNCSTRVRDVIDMAIGGRLKEASKSPAKLTFRGQTSRLTSQVWWGHFFLNLAMGSYIDRPITVWEEMFVPEKVMQMVRTVNNVDAAGNSVPLVKRETWLVEMPSRVGPPDEPPSRGWIFLLGGLLTGAGLGAAVYWLLSWNREARTPLVRRVVAALGVGTVGFVTGFFGLLFTFFWALTDHEVAYHNENLLQTGPWALAFVVIAFGLLKDRGWAFRWLRWMAYGTAALSALGLLAKALPWFDQVNLPMIAAFLPMWLGLGVGCWLGQRRAMLMQSKA